jgi:hypothetical protein
MCYTLNFFYGNKKETSRKEKISRQKKDACSSKKSCEKGKVQKKVRKLTSLFQNPASWRVFCL